MGLGRDRRWSRLVAVVDALQHGHLHLLFRPVKNSVSVTCVQRIAATPAEVWAVVADPHMQERLEPRCRLESTTGDWRTAGSEFTLAVRGVRLRYVVVEADPGVCWVAQVERSGKRAAIQTGELSAGEAGMMLCWTVTVSVGPLMRWLAQRSCERELLRWLAAVERETLANAR